MTAADPLLNTISPLLSRNKSINRGYFMRRRLGMFLFIGSSDQKKLVLDGTRTGSMLPLTLNSGVKNYRAFLNLKLDLNFDGWLRL